MESALEDPFPGLFILLDVLFSSVTFYSVTGAIIAVLLFLSAMVSGSEVAFFSLNHNDLHTCRKSNLHSDQLILKLLNHPKQLLATILIMNNLINIGIVMISTYMMWTATGARHQEGKLIVALTFIITFFIVFFGEVIPKVYANQNNLSFARKMVPFVAFFKTVFKPVSWILLRMNRVIEKRIVKRGYELSKDDLQRALELTTQEDESTEEEKEILKGIINFGSLTVKQVMRSRLDILALETSMSFTELLETIKDCGYSRIPVYNETIDKIEGILYIKDLIPYIDEGEKFAWQQLLREGFFVPEYKKIDTLLRNFQEKRIHMAIVVDEYGGTSGLITLEDVIEEIVGEINDEFDGEEIAYNQLDDQTFVFEGKISLNDFCKIVDEDPEIFDSVKGESESLGGLILELSSKLPRVGEKVTYEHLTFTVVAVDQKRIKRVRVFKKPVGKQKPAGQNENDKQ